MNDMKLSFPVSVSLFMFALIVGAHFLIESRQAELRAHVEACHLHPYSCYTPTGTLAVLR
jgi:hypothetical protein